VNEWVDVVTCELGAIMDSRTSASALDTIAGHGRSPDAAASAGQLDQFSSQLLSAMLSLRDGDFAVRLPADLLGLNGKIADVFNDIAAVSERRARETARVSHAVGKEGKLKQRMVVPGAIGGWAVDRDREQRSAVPAVERRAGRHPQTQERSQAR